MAIFDDYSTLERHQKWQKFGKKFNLRLAHYLLNATSKTEPGQSLLVMISDASVAPFSDDVFFIAILQISFMKDNALIKFKVYCLE